MRPVVCLLALAACLDSGSPPPQVTETYGKLMKVAPPPLSLDTGSQARPQPSAEEVRFDRDTELRAAVRDGRLALVPIVTKDPPAESTGFITLQAGLASGQVIAHDTGEIEVIMISNRAARPLAILGGELVIGGKQDRLVSANTVVAAHSTAAVTVVCAEPGRMSGGTQFFASKTLAEPTLRRLARTTDQLAVWDRIGALAGRDWFEGVRYREVAAAQRRGVNADRLRNLMGQLDRVDRREERGRAVGFAVAIDDKVVAIEHFASPHLYRELREMVVASYLPGSVGKPKSETAVSARDVLRFKERTGAGGPVPSRSPGAARSAARLDRP